MKHRKSAAAPLAVAATASAVLIITGFGSYAALTAEVSSPTGQDVSTGTLALTLDDNGAGFSDAVTGLAPGDTVNRYVVLENTGSLDGKTLTLEIAAAGAGSLITDGVGGVTTQALTVEVKSCPGAWTPATGACAGTVESLGGPLALGDFGTAISLSEDTFAESDSRNLQISLSLPDQDETTVNGIPPEDTIQNKTVNLTYTFGLLQRPATETNE